MTAVDWKDFPSGTTFIVGSDKHAGKTTFMKYVLEHLRSQGRRAAYMTIGIDGQQRDQLCGALKPLIVTQPGDFLVTSEGALGQSDGQLKILEVFPDKSVLGRSVLVQVLRGGYIELAGAENNRQLTDILAYIERETTAEVVLVDGAVDRVTQVAASRQAGFIMVLRITAANLKRTINQMRLLSMLDGLAQADENLTGLETFCIEGALTESKLPQIPDDCQRLVIRDYTRIFLSYEQMVRLCGLYTVCLSVRFVLRFFVVNLYGVTEDVFGQMLGREVDPGRIVFNPYMESA